MHKDKYSGEVYLELTFWSNVKILSTISENIYLPQTAGACTGKETPETKNEEELWWSRLFRTF